jgi:hypothetical protein
MYYCGFDEPGYVHLARIGSGPLERQQSNRKTAQRSWQAHHQPERGRVRPLLLPLEKLKRMFADGKRKKCLRQLPREISFTAVRVVGATPAERSGARVVFLETWSGRGGDQIRQHLPRRRSFGDSGAAANELVVTSYRPVVDTVGDGCAPPPGMVPRQPGDLLADINPQPVRCRLGVRKKADAVDGENWRRLQRVCSQRGLCGS